MKKDNLRKVEVLESEVKESSNGKIKVVEKPLYQGYFHEYIKNNSNLVAIIEREDGRLEQVSIYDIRFLD